MSLFDSPEALTKTLADLPMPDANARAAATVRQRQLTKPPGSLGRLEDIAIFVAGWHGRAVPEIRTARAIVFAGNHGVTAQGVSAYPAAVTRQMVANFRAGGAAINALAAASGLDLLVVPIDLDRPTEDFTQAPAMTVEECVAAMARGAAAIDRKFDLVVLGEMGIGNSTVAAALCAASLGGSATGWVGPGTGVHGTGLTRKCAAVEAGLARHSGALTTPIEILRRLGGRELAAIAGAVIAARMRRIPVILDGFIGCAALAPFKTAHPALTDHCLAGHLSAEPGHGRLLGHLGLRPLLALDMRLGEGSGGALAAQIVRAALDTHAGMATFADAGVSEGVTTAFALHLLRHGEPVSRDRMLGATDCDVTQRGISDCLAQAARVTVEHVVTSDLKRARDCATAINAQASVDPRWRELDFGAWDGLPSSEIDGDALAAFWSDPDAGAPPRGERWSALRARVAAAIDALEPRATLVVTHGGAIRAALSGLCGIPYWQTWCFDLPYAALVSLSVWPGERRTAQITAIHPCDD